jgi:hypothetical protein
MNFLIESVMVAINSGEPPPPKEETTIKLGSEQKDQDKSNCCFGAKSEEKSAVKTVI